jgi:hypothetical protein
LGENEGIYMCDIEISPKNHQSPQQAKIQGMLNGKPKIIEEKEKQEVTEGVIKIRGGGKSS